MIFTPLILQILRFALNTIWMNKIASYLLHVTVHHYVKGEQQNMKYGKASNVYLNLILKLYANENEG